MKFLSVEEFENFDSLPDQARINFKKSIADVNSGEVWNALSRARMTLEGELKLRLQGIGLHKKRLGAGGMLNILRQNMKISDGDYKSLRYAIGVCNRGVHGEDVHPAHAGEAIHVIVSYLTSDESLQNSL